MMDMESIKTNILLINYDELNAIQDTIKYRNNELAKKAKNAFQVNNRVSFETPKYGKITGTITKINRKKIVVSQDNDFSIYHVPATMLTLISDD